MTPPDPVPPPLPAQGCILWLTGLPGSGKTTLATTLAAEFARRGLRHFVLDGDVLRRGLCSDLGFSQADRSENIRRAGEVARLLAGTGMICLAAFVSPYRADRDRIRQGMEPGRFIEIHVNAPLEVCERRDPKGHYQRARANTLSAFTGVSDPYEPPLNPEIVLRTAELSVDECVAQVLAFLRLA
jgi:adenylyl-sulfate kinase